MHALLAIATVKGPALDYAAAIGLGTTYLVALAAKEHWPKQAKFAIAAVIAAGAAIAGVAIAGPITWQAFVAALGPAFIAQQAAWHLQLPIVGDPAILDKLLTLGGPPPTPESVDTSIPAPEALPGEQSADAAAPALD